MYEIYDRISNLEKSNYSSVRYICNQERKLHDDSCEEEEDKGKEGSEGLLGGSDVAECSVTDAELNVGHSILICVFS